MKKTYISPIVETTTINVASVIMTSFETGTNDDKEVTGDESLDGEFGSDDKGHNGGWVRPQYDF